jgi:hypothetical protein
MPPVGRALGRLFPQELGLPPWPATSAGRHTASSGAPVLGIGQTNLRDYQAHLGTPFPYSADLAEFTALRGRLKAGLSGAALEPGSEVPASVAQAGSAAVTPRRRSGPSRRSVECRYGQDRK